MIAVIADDLSGATELAAIADAHGLTAEVQTEFDASSEARVIAVDTDSRGGTVEVAVRKVSVVAEHVLAAKPEWIYKKTDSVLRGHVRAEISTLLSMTGQARANFVPANPGRGRVIREGKYFVDGVPLDKTVFANDPQYPARTSVVREILGEEPRIFVPNVESGVDLDCAVATANDKTLCAGASEFFSALLAARTGKPLTNPPALQAGGSVLFVCGSAAAWPIRRKQCAERGIAALPMERANELVRAVKNFGAALVAIGDEARTESPRELEEMLAQAVEMIWREARPERVFLEGGATASAVLRKMKANRLSVCGHFSKGICAFRIPGREKPILAIKPGSYPWPENVWPQRA